MVGGLCGGHEVGARAGGQARIEPSRHGVLMNLGGGAARRLGSKSLPAAREPQHTEKSSRPVWGAAADNELALIKTHLFKTIEMGKWGGGGVRQKMVGAMGRRATGERPHAWRRRQLPGRGCCPAQQPAQRRRRLLRCVFNQNLETGPDWLGES